MQRAPSLGLLALIPTLALQAAPDFQDYAVPASQIFKGKSAAPRFKTAGQRNFRTMIREGATKGAVFAGHYAVAQWGCGSACVQVALIDVQTGEVFDGPLGALPDARISFELTGDADRDAKQGIEYRIDSRLWIARGCPNEANCGVYYYEWMGAGFKLLSRTLAKQ